MRTSTSTFLICVLVFGPLAGCGGGGGGASIGGGAQSHRPVISNLVVSPSMVLHNQGGGSVFVDVSVEFTDEDANVSSISTVVLDSSGGELSRSFDALPQLRGQTGGMAEVAIPIDTETVGTFAIRVWLLDSSLNESNTLEMQLTVT